MNTSFVSNYKGRKGSALDGAAVKNNLGGLEGVNEADEESSIIATP